MIARRGGGKEPALPAGSQHVTPTTTSSIDRQEAFRAHVEPEIEVLLRVARTLTGSWADAEDVVQDTLIRAWGAVDRFDGAHPRAWLLTILRHTHLNSLRRRRPDLFPDASELGAHRPAFGAAAPIDPEQRHTDNEFSPALTDAIAALDPRYRTALLLIDVDQLTYAEAAAALDVPVGTVMSRLSRARDKVRRRLRAAAVTRETRDTEGTER